MKRTKKQILLTLMTESSASPQSDPSFTRQRRRMVADQLIPRGINCPRVLQAMQDVPRELFMPPDLTGDAYDDGPRPIGHGQTISQPYTVAFGVEALGLDGHEKVLEIGTGSGYAAAVLAQLAASVHTIERIPELAGTAAQHLQQAGITNVTVHTGDGSQGLLSEAPFDAIIAAAGAPSLPQNYSDQLSDGGRIVLPIGPMHQQSMMRFTKRSGRLIEENLGAFCFVPLIGTDAWSAS